jgi:hypothetical protein
MLRDTRQQPQSAAPAPPGETLAARARFAQSRAKTAVPMAPSGRFRLRLNPDDHIARRSAARFLPG